MSDSKHGMGSGHASHVKRSGHAAEVQFNLQFGHTIRHDINASGASADCQVTRDPYQSVLKKKFGVSSLNTSLKAGKTWQFHLGRLDELSDKEHFEQSLTQKLVRGRLATCGVHNVPWSRQLEVLHSVDFWLKYLGKGCDLLCYNPKEGRRNSLKYTFYGMYDVCAFLSSDGWTWRLKETGRIKGDYKKRQYVTFEYRPESHKRQFVIGAHGGKKGEEFEALLHRNLPSQFFEL